MKHVALVLSAMALSVGLPAWSQNYGTVYRYWPTASDYMHQCGNVDALTGRELAGCVGFIDGAWQGFAAGIDDPKKPKVSVSQCVPNGADAADRLKVVSAYLTAHPEELQYTAASEVAKAFLSLYCPLK